MNRTLAGKAPWGPAPREDTGRRPPERTSPRAWQEQAQLRQADASDRWAIREFVCRLSVRTQQLRFFACVAPPSSGLLRALCGASDRSDVLIVTDSSGAVIAHGMAADTPANETLESDIGLVVADAWQRRGIGTLLLRTLIGRAAGRGVGSLVLEVLPDNPVMLGIIGRRWPGLVSERTADSLVFRPAIERLDHWQLPTAFFIQ